ncbi:MAG: mRNA surveillance protein pelota [Candidatus Methanomethylophilus sp.]|nr:mRNA surveillance protein pelota [Methanomethylophilus sp.]MBQ5448279.1 mRNA surveillance protein pelota [Methanomethylophilus sp.]
MRILGKDAGRGEIKVLPETDDDIWHLYNVICVGDLVTASTTRRDEKADDKLRAERAEKKRMTLGIRIEKVEFEQDSMRMRLLGIIEEGPQDIGQHHTLIIEVGEQLRIGKTHWKSTQVERLESAVKDTVKPRIVFVSLDQDEATVAVLRAYGLKEIVTVRSMRSGKQYDEKGKPFDYHGEIISKLKSVATPEMPLVLLGPGFEKEELAEDIAHLPKGTFGQVFVQQTGQSGMAGVNELIKSGLGSRILRESTVGAEMELVNRLMEEIGKNGLATYGPAEVESAADSGAVENLLILDTLLREKDLDRVVHAVEQQNGTFTVISSEHDAGKQLAALGGIAAILRYKLS